ncbi:MAG: fasciclin domain-containing protein [Chitinophagaceae bacterium]
MNIKNLFYALTFSVIAFGALSCKKDESGTPTSTSITAQVVAAANLSLLESAVVKANLATTLDGAGSFTVFAPTDDAFAASGITAATISSLTAQQLSAILLYHTLPAKIMAADVPAGPNAKVITAGGDSVFVTKNANGVFVNGVNVTQADITASNGVIHLISRVLLPPTGNIVQVAQSNANFTFLVAAVVRASSGSTNVAQILSSGGPFTVFAPTNDAFIAAGFADIAAINAADPNTLASILTYHVVAGRVFSSDLTNGATPTTANGGTVTIALSGTGATVKGKTNMVASNIIGTNVMARNGVIHVIDRVLLP